MFNADDQVSQPLTLFEAAADSGANFACSGRFSLMCIESNEQRCHAIVPTCCVQESNLLQEVPK